MQMANRCSEIQLSRGGASEGNRKRSVIICSQILLYLISLTCCMRISTLKGKIARNYTCGKEIAFLFFYFFMMRLEAIEWWRLRGEEIDLGIPHTCNTNRIATGNIIELGDCFK